MTDVQAQPVTPQDLWVRLEVVRCRHVHPIAVRLCPVQERPLPVPPPRAAAPIGQAEGPRPVPIAHGFLVRLGLHHAADRLRIHQEPLRERPLERYARPAGVQRRPAPVVVGVPRGGGEHEQERSGVLWMGTDDETRVGPFVAGAHGDGVVTRSPAVGGDIEGDGPPAAVLARVGGHVVPRRADGLRVRDLGLRPVARHANVDAPGIGGDPELRSVSRFNGQRPAVRLEHGRSLVSARTPVTVAASGRLRPVPSCQP